MARAAKVERSGFQVLVQVEPTRTFKPTVTPFTAYTSKKLPLTLEMAQSYAAHLKRSHAGGQIIELPSGRVVEQWAKA